MIELDRVCKTFGQGATAVQAVREISLSMAEGAFTSIVGTSGSGKSTLLHLIAGLDRPSAGHVRLWGEDLGALDDDRLTLLRRRRIGLVFQFFNLLPALSAVENVALPLLLEGQAQVRGTDKARHLLDLVGLGHRALHKPEELSGGEAQRVAIARALVTDAPLVLADEPTGSLDSRTGRDILEILARFCRERALTVVMVTHDLQAAEIGDRVITLRDGRVLDDRPAGGPR